MTTVTLELLATKHPIILREAHMLVQRYEKPITVILYPGGADLLIGALPPAPDRVVIYS